MPRLYVGGLSHSVTQKDLTDRFGKFGNVEDVELRTRRDDEGVPYKTFAYIDLNISDTDLRKCMSVLNKSKWKGGTLQIEPAKQSLLHKFAQERQEEEKQQQQQSSRRDADDKHRNACKLLESLGEAGVDNFTMKAAVPGTEIPGHKDWVVSKFGRVLPVMQLRCQKGSKARTVKYDPSKYCHNIRRLAPPTAAAAADPPPTPVARLTWRIDGGDDDISKKRRGEFPPYRPPEPKTTRTDAVKSAQDGNNASPAQVVVAAKPENRRPSNGLGRDEESDSDEEIRRLVALQQASHNAPGPDAQEDNLEVVGDDYLVKSGGSRRKWAAQSGATNEDDYDSADTDELFASGKNPLAARKNDSAAGKRTNKMAALSKEEDEEEISTSRKPSLPPQEKPVKWKRKSKKEDERTTPEPPSEDEEEAESSAFDFRAMFSDATHVRISLDDLRKLAEESTGKRAAPNPRVPPRKEILPEDILASLLADDGGEDDRPEWKKKKKGRKVDEVIAETEAPDNKMAALSSSSEEEEAAAAAARRRLSAREEAARHRKDNSRRLAAVQQRRKEAEEHKKLIQGALANVDAVTARTGKHIVFDSDDEPTTAAASETCPLGDSQSEDEDNEATANEIGRTEDQERAGTSGRLRLFGGSEDGDDEEDDDGGGFHIRPQFEGQAGQKLMEMQSRFGTDKRFRMDRRFLEEEQEEEKEQESEEKGGVALDEDVLQEEKRRNMSILRDLLGHPADSGKTAAKTKTFRDVSTLHYDPSRDEHAHFETKADGDKDSKSARRKKREEAHKLPEVSKEIFYHVADDLKAMFGPAPADDRQTDDRPKTSWDQQEEEEEEEEEKDEEQPTPVEHSGFMFSFFGDDVQTASQHKEYKVESVQSPKVLPWQQDPRLQDSSEEDDDDEEEAPEEESDAAPKNATEQTVSSTSNFFFFHLDDSRLTEGPEWFRRSLELEEEREEWEERRAELRQEYRKKHKDARRKLRSSQKT
ncbi:nucleolar protein 8 isoform X2 [Festucalex cinctus]